jgi:2-polyprenyl-3-methyl-5-hydroxy-6-metoxy-1,4-benzoquinol methylase
MFGPELARKDARRYRRKGLRGSGRTIVERAREAGLGGAEVLEIGGGIGALAVELVEAGAARATSLEVSAGYEAAARELRREHGLEQRLELRIADVVEDETVGPADIVVMERVVCCYPDAEALVGAAAEHARRRLVLSYPRYGMAARLFVRGGNLVLRLRGSAFRIYAHAPDTIRSAATSRGLRPVGREQGIVWRVAAFERGA